jgi:SpoVK/Ycf46/Vps4 family AAA+-type ATPase
MTDDALLTSLLAAVSAAPDDVPLRLHVAELLAAAQRVPEALPHVTHALTVQPGDTAAIALLQRLGAMLAAPVTPQPPTEFDWGQAEDQVRDVRQPAFAQDSPSAVTEDVDLAERPSLRLADVGGMEQVKQRLELSFLGPIRNPQLASAFGATAAGGLLLYGPPGCGKTFIARAVAGEIGARFSEFGVADVLDMWTGSSERNLAQIFAAARRNAPCVLFFDEVDALGHKRSHLTTSSSMRNTVNQLLSEMDSLGGRNDGVFVLGATNHREAILRHHLRDRPLAGVDLGKIARATEHYSGADLAHLCTTAAERALAESMRSGRLVPLTTRDLLTAAREVQPSTGPWFAAARNVALFGNTDGSYDELAAYLKKHRSL